MIIHQDEIPSRGDKAPLLSKESGCLSLVEWDIITGGCFFLADSEKDGSDPPRSVKKEDGTHRHNATKIWQGFAGVSDPWLWPMGWMK